MIQAKHKLSAMAIKSVMDYLKFIGDPFSCEFIRSGGFEEIDSLNPDDTAEEKRRFFVWVKRCLSIYDKEDGMLIITYKDGCTKKQYMSGIAFTDGCLSRIRPKDLKEISPPRIGMESCVEYYYPFLRF